MCESCSPGTGLGWLGSIEPTLRGRAETVEFGQHGRASLRGPIGRDADVVVDRVTRRGEFRIPETRRSMHMIVAPVCPESTISKRTHLCTPMAYHGRSQSLGASAKKGNHLTDTCGSV